MSRIPFFRCFDLFLRLGCDATYLTRITQFLSTFTWDTIRHIMCDTSIYHDNVIKWKHFTRYWPFVRRIHRSQMNSQHKGQWCGALMFSLICAWINGWVNNREAGDLRRHRTQYDATVMTQDAPPTLVLRRSAYLKAFGTAHDSLSHVAKLVGCHFVLIAEIICSRASAASTWGMV